MDAIELLKQQHREVEELFAQVEQTDAQTEKARLFRDLASKLVAHDGIEREIFYPACEEALGLSDELGEALVEHGIVEFGLYQADQAVGQPDFGFKLKALKELVQHHVKEEEDELLPKIKKALDDEQLESLGEELLDAFEEAQSEDYHEPLFENLRQVLIGALKPVVPDIEERAEPRGAAAPNRKASRKSA